ncbi:MAG: shikimate kinase [Dehalococcoidia bacterium]|nr:shikimate kinase [Dehalococcoidia bacterium]
MPRTSIALVGFMCAGKSTVGRLLAERLCKTFVETDALVEERTGLSVAQVFSSWGEERFRELEAEVVSEVSTRGDAVIACGGGVVLRPSNVKLLRGGAVVVYLDVSPEKVLQRLGPPSDVRPLLSGEDRETRVLKLMEQRMPAYRAAAELVVDTSVLSPQAVAADIERLLRQYERTHREE